MPQLILKTEINAPVERCFDLSRSIDLHKISTADSDEEAIAGVTSGLIGLNETVTWRARHLGITQKLSTKITAFTPYASFTDEMINGTFSSMVHHHRFVFDNGRTIMTDEFNFESPFKVLGRFANWLILEKYMYRLILKRNAIIKEFAESDLWKRVLPGNK